MSRTLRFRPRTIRGEDEIGGSAPTISVAPTKAAEIQSVSSTQMAQIQEAGQDNTNFTTTNTTDWQNLIQIFIEVPSGNMAFQFGANADFSHSAPAAEVSFRVLLSFGAAVSGGSYNIRDATNLYLATATKSSSVHLGMMYNIASNLPSVSTPGLKEMVFQVFNHTAGTLTVFSGFAAYAFITGDLT